jgi:homoserine dehydrogenase
MVATEGIRDVQRDDIAFARNLGYTLKLLAVIKAGDSGVEARVQPTLVPSGHVLASIKGPFNAVLVRGDVLGDALFYGRGAGADATASAVLADLAELAAGRDAMPGAVGGALYARLKSVDEIVSRYYLRLQALDEPGVLAKIAGILGARKISISSAIQPEGKTGAYVPLVFMLHNAQEKQFQQALEEIAQLPVVQGPPVRWRVEDFT